MFLYNFESMTVIFVYILHINFITAKIAFIFTIFNIVFSFRFLEKSFDIMSRSLCLLNLLELDFSFIKPSL